MTRKEIDPINSNKIGNAIGVLFFLIVVIFSLRSCFVQNFELMEIRADKSFTIGKIIEVSKMPKPPSYSMSYKYFVNDTSYSDTYRGHVKGARKFLGKRFPVIYSSKNHSASRILIDPKDFEEFGLSYPDSLEWVYDLSRY
jgi:hypothetical protein